MQIFMEYQKYKLKDIATINSGYSFRTKIQNNPEGNTFVIQMRDISNDHSKIVNTLSKVDGTRIHEKHFLQKNDILFMAKGANNFSVCYDENYKPAVAASAFFVIRLTHESILPAFVCLYINSALGQNYLQANMAGTYIPNINKSTLAEMKLLIPSQEEQKKIITIYKLYNQEKDLLSQILMKKQIMMDEFVKQLITKKLKFNDGK